ncbi:hypothetical protein MKQ68_17235 [Chitinophaga horti]|uniref:Dialkylresorcinol condensing enzyme n=1 Tax=Chitinophaga horti TaxID=2920382 RepID=A0ABY6J114_9BACT|nr:hypothetical protein [Chitinophaga horti]UYQ91832.1 hypothetical protein MKQ68_17235 [Chitinophaga horti]
MTDNPKILVIYFTQTGQLKAIIDRVLAPLQGKADIRFEQIVPVAPFPFPWTKQQFYDAMPECVLHRPRAIEPLKTSADEHFDLVVLAYQPWFLSPSQPVTAFLQSEAGKRLLKGKNVLTLVGARNMWLNPQERVKQYLKDAGANLVGNVVLVDKHNNLVSVLTVFRWAFKGQKEASGLLPEAGVSSADIQAASRFGEPIARALVTKDWSSLQPALLKLGAVEINPGLVVLEARAQKPFRFWAGYIAEKGGPGAAERQGRIKMYRTLLILGIFTLTPISAISAKFAVIFKKKELEDEVEYHKGVSLR